MAVVSRSVAGYAFLLLAALLLPGALAYSADDPQLYWYEHEIRTIAPDTDLLGVVLNITLSSDFQRCWDERPLPVSCALVLDTDGLAALDNYRLDIRDRCHRDNATITCATVAATLRTPNGTIRIGYAGQAGTERNIAGTMTIQLQLDNTTPRVARIATGACDETACFIAANVPSPVTVTFNDTLTSYDWRLVFLGRDGSVSIARAANCSGATCVAQIITPCQDGQEFTLALTSAGGVSSREDAQNPVAPFPGQRVLCKTQGPRITNLTMTADGIAGQAVSGGTLRATARIIGGVGDVVAAVATRGMLGENGTNSTVSGSCAGDAQGALDCAWQLGPLADGTFTLSFTATDALGLYSTREERVTVLRLIGGGPNGTVPDLVRATVTDVNPESINRMALDLARSNHLPYPLYVQYGLEARSASVRVHGQEFASCAWRLPGAANWTESPAFFASPPDSRVFREHANASEPNRLDLQIRADRTTLSASDVFEANCTVRVIVQDGSALYAEPEKESILFTARLRETALGQPGAAFVEKIRREEEKLKGPDQKLLLTLREIRATMDGVCSIMESINTLSTSGSITELIGLGAEATGVGSGPAQAIIGAGHGIFKSGQKISATLWQDESGDKFLKNVCAQVNCRNLEKTKGAQLFNDPEILQNIRYSDSGFADNIERGDTGSENVGQYALGSITQNLDTPNVEDSFVMSALQLCVGGMIYNAGKWQDINCGYLQCLKDQSLNGQSTAVCEQGKNYKLCTQFVGEVFELPFARVIKNLAENINRIVQNLPAYLLKWATNAHCKPLLEQPPNGQRWDVYACHALKAVTDVTDFMTESQQGLQGITQSDNAICLEALCSAEDAAKGKCKTSFNRVQQYQQYSDYLRIETWARDKRATQTEQNKATAKNIKNTVCGDALYCEILDIEKQSDTYVVSAVTYTDLGFSEGEEISKEITSQNNPDTYRTLETIPENVRAHPAFPIALNDGFIPTDEKSIIEYQAVISQRNLAIKDDEQAKLLAEYQKCGENENCKKALGSELEKNGFTTNKETGAIETINGRPVTETELKDAGAAIKQAKYFQTFDLILHVGLKIALDQGYLDWLSTSYWGDWAFTEQSEQYLTKEGWAENLCNDFKFDINDNDDGAIYVTDEDSFPRPVGTFAAEIREARDDNDRVVYLYLITILIDNPLRPAPFGVSDDEFAQRNSFRVDAALNGGVEPFDLINGTFDLALGATFGDSDGPKRALFVLPQKYDRLCVTFDKAFPDSTGKTVYCRQIVEDAYDRGSPVPPQAASGLTGGTGGAGSVGTSNGCLYGSVSGC